MSRQGTWAEGVSDYRARLPLIIAAILATIIVLVVLSIRYVPLVDYPNHIARAYLLSGVSQNADLLARYMVNYAPIPNVAADIVLTALIRVAGTLIGARLFVALIVVIWTIGVSSLSYKIWKHWTWNVPLAVLLALHGPLQYGFVNFAFGAGIALCALACWLHWIERPTIGALAAVLAAVFATYFSHLAAFGVVGVACASVLFYRDVLKSRNLLQAVYHIAPVASPIILFLMFMQKGGEVGAVLFNSVQGKLFAGVSPLRTYNLKFDLAVCVVLASCGALILLQNRAKKAHVFDPSTLAIVAGLAVAFLILPQNLMTSGGVDARVPPVLAVMLVLCVRPASSSWSTFVPYGVALLVLSVRLGVLLADWQSLSGRVQQFVTLVDAVPQRSSLIPLYSTEPGFDEEKRHRVLEHAFFYAVPRRDVYVPLMFARASQQPLIAKHWAWGDVSRAALFEEHRDSFQYILAAGDSAVTAVNTSRCCTRVAGNADAVLFRNP
jgi:hypothetical protein